MSTFSVVIPLYNKEPHIKRAVDSVLSQTIQDFEIIVVDDGSTDKSVKIVRSIADNRIRLITQENKGVSSARNRGIGEAKADLIAFLDADDEWQNNFLKEILELKNKYPEAGAYATAYNMYLPDGKIRIAKYKAIPPAPWNGLLPSYFLAAASGEHPISSSSICIRKEVFLDIGGFKPGAWWGEDDDMWGRIALKYPIAFSWQVGAIYHHETVNRACEKREKLEHPFIKTAEKAILNGKIPEHMIKDLNDCIESYKISSASNNISRGHSEIAREILKDCKTKRMYRKKLYYYFLSVIPYKVLILMSKIKRSMTNNYKIS